MIGAARGSDQTVLEAAVTTGRHLEQCPPLPKRSSSCATQTDTLRLYALRMRPQIRYRSLNVITPERPKRYARPSGIRRFAGISTRNLFSLLAESPVTRVSKYLLSS